MAPEDGFERAGIVLGAVLLVPVPIFVIVGAFVGPTHPSWLWPAVLVSGLVVGLAIAQDWIPIEYRDLWYVCVLGAILTVFVWFQLGLLTPTDHQALATVTWVLALVAAAGLSRLRLGRLLPS